MPEDFKKILTLIDFSNASLHAAEEAALIASKFKSQLHLLHVNTNANASYLLVPEIYFLKIAGRDKNNVDSVAERLRKIKEDLDTRFGIDVQYHEAEGKLCEMVNKQALELNADLVVLGVNHDNWFKDLFSKNKTRNI